MTSTELPSGTRVYDVHDGAELGAALAEVGLGGGGRPVIVLIGGAAGVDQSSLDELYPIVRDGIVATAAGRGAALIDGGTNSGVMALAGRARAELSSDLPLIGIAPRGRVSVPGLAGGGSTELEPRHSHVMLVPGEQWGAESGLLVEAARIVAAGRPVVTILLDGGPLALAEAMACAAHGWPIVTLAGSGRSADILARYARGASEPGLSADRHGIHVVAQAAGPSALADMVGRLLDGGRNVSAAADGTEFRSADYPALYLAASEAAKRGQRIFKRLSLGEILLTATGLSIALATTLIFPGPDEKAIRDRNLIVGGVTALFFLIALVLKFINRSSGFDTDWYNGRALAEAVKGLTWRYIMRSEPFATDEPSADRRLRLELASLLRRRSGFRQALDRLPLQPQQISPAMRSIRARPVAERRDRYLSARLLAQARWYQQRGAAASRWSSRWYWLSVAAQITGAVLAVLVLATGEDALRLMALAGAIALAMTAWSQLNRYDELARSYGMALQELLLIAAVADQVTTEDQLKELVRDAEEAIFREHRLWMAKRSEGMAEEETGEDELEPVEAGGAGGGADGMGTD